jgi:3-hydroxybutyryl-CoA dehydrogenase
MPELKPELKKDCQVGVVGMGLMGTSIATCLLAAGHKVAGVSDDPGKNRAAADRIRHHLEEMREEGLLKPAVASCLTRFSVSADFKDLKGSALVIESVFEELKVKRQVIASIEKVVGNGCLIGSNTSAIPITLLQQGARRPERVMGLHWGEPAHVTRFLEVICGKKTRLALAQRVFDLSSRWDKEPTLVRKDVRGFVTNRLMYALMREAFHLVDSGVATVQDVDRAARNDAGYWIGYLGIFRMMDVCGVQAFANVMKDLFPDLNSQKTMPRLMQKVAGSGAKGIANLRGFYRYTPASAKRWEKRFMQFNYEIRRLEAKYAKDHRN